MKRFVLLYRGINVLGNRVVKMELLRAMHEELGHRDVQSYIQSGNLVLSAAGTAQALAKKIGPAFSKAFGFSAQLMIVEAANWSDIIGANPFAAQAKANYRLVHAAICEGAPSAGELKALLTKTGGTETFEIKSNILYLHAPDGFGTSKFAARMEKASGVPMTVRNWRTMEALHQLLASGPVTSSRGKTAAASG